MTEKSEDKPGPLLQRCLNEGTVIIQNGKYYGISLDGLKIPLAAAVLSHDRIEELLKEYPRDEW